MRSYCQLEDLHASLDSTLQVETLFDHCSGNLQINYLQFF